MADDTKPTTTSSSGQEMKKTLNAQQIGKLRRGIQKTRSYVERTKKAFSTPETFRDAFKVAGARGLERLERASLSVLGSTLGEAVYQARREMPGKKAQAVKKVFIASLASKIGGIGIVGETLANKLRNQRRFEDDPQQEFEKIRDNFLSVSKDLKQINQNFESIKKNQDKIIQATKDTDNKVTKVQQDVDRVERQFGEFESKFSRLEDTVKMHKGILDNHEMRIKALEQKQDEVGSKEKKSKDDGLDWLDLFDWDKKKKNKRKRPRQRTRTRTRTPQPKPQPKPRSGFPKLGIAGRLLGGAGIYLTALEIAEYQREKDEAEGYTDAEKAAEREKISKNLKLSRQGPRRDTVGLAGTVEGMNQVRALTQRARQRARQSSASKPASQKKGLFGLVGGFPDTKSSAARQMKGQLPFAESFDRQMIEREKSRFLQFGQLPSGFEFLPGHMGRLGSPEAVAARGIMPLGGYGGVAGVPGMPSGGYATGGGNAAGYTTGPVANAGREETTTGGRGGDPAVNVPLSGKLGEDRRARFEKELKDNPQLMSRLYNLARTEVGANPRNQQLFLETVFNRAMFSNKSISNIVSSVGRGGYYPGIKSYNPSATEMENFRSSVVGDIMKGSNRTNLATDNASNAPRNPVAANRERAGATGAWLGEGRRNISQEYYYRGGSGAGRYRTAHGVRAEQYAAELARSESRVSTPGTPTSGAMPAPGATSMLPRVGGVFGLPEGASLGPGGGITSGTQQQSVPGTGGTSIIQRQHQAAGIRRLPIKSQLETYLEYARQQSGVGFEITSGGQRRHGLRTGSHRHDIDNPKTPGAADGKLFVMENGKKRYLSIYNPNDRELISNFTRAFSSVTPGAGIGTEYMGKTREARGQLFHFGGPNSAGGKAVAYAGPDWFRAAHSQGVAAFGTVSPEELAKIRLGIPGSSTSATTTGLNMSSGAGISIMPGTFIVGPGAEAFQGMMPGLPAATPTSSAAVSPVPSQQTTSALEQFQKTMPWFGKGFAQPKTDEDRFKSIYEPTITDKEKKISEADAAQILLKKMKGQTVQDSVMTMAISALGIHEAEQERDLKSFIGRSGKGDQNAWCAAFIGSLFKKHDIKPPTNFELATNWNNFGSSVEFDSVKPGDLFVAMRGLSPGEGAGKMINGKKTYGHVALIVEPPKIVDGKIQLRVMEGNAGDRVGIVTRTYTKEEWEKEQARFRRPDYSKGTIVFGETERNSILLEIGKQIATEAPTAPTAVSPVTSTPEGTSTTSAPVQTGTPISPPKPKSFMEFYGLTPPSRSPTVPVVSPAALSVASTYVPGSQTPTPSGVPGIMYGTMPKPEGPAQPQQMPPEATTIPPPSGPPSSGPGTIGGILGGYGKGPGTEKNEEQRNVDKAYRESGLAQQSLEQAQQQIAQSEAPTPQSGTDRNTSGGNRGHHPESAPASPGTGGSGSYGRCFV